jgi:transposase
MEHHLREIRNQILTKLLDLGLSQAVIGQVTGLSQPMVSKIARKIAQNEPITKKAQGGKPKLSEAQIAELPNFLKRGSEFYEFTGDYWTHKRVKYVIQKEFNVVYETKQVGRILHSINWTWQKPQKKDAKQDPEKVEKWQQETLPALKKKAINEDYEIYFHDESTLQLCANIVKTYSPRGETPIIPLNDTKGYQHVCIAISISVTGKKFYQIRDNSFKGDAILQYLKDLLATTTGKIMLIWDNATWHKAQEIKDFLVTDLGKRLWLANTPPYSPEYNPDELVWSNLKKVQIPNTIAKNVKELHAIAHIGMKAIQNSAQLVKSFFNSTNFYFTTS